MFRRVLCFALLAAVLPVFSLTIPAATPAKSSPTAKRSPSTTGPESKSRPFRLSRKETITTKQLASIFSWAARQKDIAYRYPVDGCYARAHLLITRMEKAGYKPYKVWSMENGEPLYARTKNHPKGYVTWKYHVAPIVRVRFTDDKQAWFVIDPSLFSQPVKISTWRKAQQKPGSKRVPYVTVSRLGKAPLNRQHKRLAGSGYWPGSDPPEGLDAHARRTMKRYKLYEGKLLPRSVTASDESDGRTIPWGAGELARARSMEIPLD
jgi:hypothetical protein